MTIDSPIRRQLMSRSIAPMECTIPPDMTIGQWRRTRPARSQRAACDQMHDTTTRYDPVEKLLTFLLICPVCGTEKALETLHYKPRFQPLPATRSTGATVHRLPSRRDAQRDRRAA